MRAFKAKTRYLNQLVERSKKENSGRCRGCCGLSDGEWKKTVPSEAARKEVTAREERYLKDSRHG